MHKYFLYFIGMIFGIMEIFIVNLVLKKMEWFENPAIDIGVKLVLVGLVLFITSKLVKKVSESIGTGIMLAIPAIIILIIVFVAYLMSGGTVSLIPFL